MPYRFARSSYWLLIGLLMVDSWIPRISVRITVLLGRLSQNPGLDISMARSNITWISLFIERKFESPLLTHIKR